MCACVLLSQRNSVQIAGGRWGFTQSATNEDGLRLSGQCFWARAFLHTLMDMHTELKAVPPAGLGFHFLRVRVRTTEPRGLQEEIGPKSQDRRRRSSRHDDVRSGLPNVATCEVLGLASCHSEDSENGRYVWLIRPDIRMYCGRFVGPSLTAHGWPPCWKTNAEKR